MSRLERQVMFAEVADLVVCGYLALAFIYAFGAYGLGIYVPLTLVYVFTGRRRLWAWHFARRVSWFRCVSKDRIDLHYAPEFQDEELLREILRWAATDRDEFTERFGIKPLRGSVRIFLFENDRHLRRSLNGLAGEWPLTLCDTVILKNTPELRELLRHQIARLCALRLNRLAPRLLAAGLATWMEGQTEGESVDSRAASLLGEPVSLHSLLRHRFFFNAFEPGYSEAFAGSFTGYLLRRYGWSAYRRLYRVSTGLGFRTIFRRCLGTRLEDAEADWRRALPARARMQEIRAADLLFNAFQ